MGIMERINDWFGDARWSDPEIENYDGALLADLLPYRTFAPETGLFHNEETTGFIFETMPVAYSEDIPPAFHAALTAHCPANATVQVLNWMSPGIDGHLDAWSEHRVQHSDVMRRASQSRMAVFKDRRFGDDAIIRTIPHHRRVFICAYMDGDAGTYDSAQLSALRDALISSVGGANNIKSLGPKELIRLTAELINLRIFGNVPNIDYDDRVAINQQLAGASLNVSAKGLTFSSDPEMAAATATISKFPSDYRFDLTRYLSGPSDRPALSPRGPVLTTLTMRAMPSSKSTSKLMRKHASLEHTSATGFARFANNLSEKIDEVKDLTVAIEGGEKLFETVMTVTAFTKGGLSDARSALSEMATIYRAQGFEFQNDQRLQLPTFLAGLPFGIDKTRMDGFERLMRMKWIKARALSELIPLYGEWTGNGSGKGVLLTGRQGQICAWNNFDSKTNFNVAVTGASGGGKSVLMQELVSSRLADGGQVIVIDDGYSFARLCEAFEGQFVGFDGRKPIRLNPFTLIDADLMADPSQVEYRSDALELITKTVATMASLSENQVGRVQGVEEDLIRDAVAQVWAEFGSASEITNVRDRLKALATQEPRLSDIVTKLGRFSKGGDFGSYFEGPADLSLNAQFAVFELSDIKAQRGLESVVLQLIMFVASEAMFKSARDQSVSIVIDEAWDLLHGDMTGRFLEGIVRRARKYKGGLITGTQSLSDYDKSVATRVCLENSDTLIMLRQNSDTLDGLAAAGKLQASPGLLHELKSMTSVPGSFSEMAIRDGEGKYIFGRLMLDTYSLALYSSRAETVAAIDAARHKGMTMAEAISHVAQSGRAI